MIISVTIQPSKPHSLRATCTCEASEAPEYTVPRPRVKNAASVDEKMVDAFKKVFFDQMSAEQALEELNTELNDFINENY